MCVREGGQVLFNSTVKINFVPNSLTNTHSDQTEICSYNTEAGFSICCVDHSLVTLCGIVSIQMLCKFHQPKDILWQNGANSLALNTKMNLILKHKLIFISKLHVIEYCGIIWW